MESSAVQNLVYLNLLSFSSIVSSFKFHRVIVAAIKICSNDCLSIDLLRFDQRIS